MRVKRIVANIATDNIAAAKRFYADILGLDVLMDHGWIATYGGPQTAAVQVGIASEGGSGTPVPDLSVEVDDLDDLLLAQLREHVGHEAVQDRCAGLGADLVDIDGGRIGGEDAARIALLSTSLERIAKEGDVPSRAQQRSSA